MAYAGTERSYNKGFHIPDPVYFTGSALLYSIIILVLLYVSSLFNNPWTTYDVGRFYAMAEGIVNGATPYLGEYADPKPPLIFFTLAVPTLLGQAYLGGLLLVGVCNFVSAVLVMKMGWNLYGRFSGFLAGLLFTINIAWAQGYFVLTEPFTVMFVLLGTYALMFTDLRYRYLMAGLSIGLGIGFKQYAAFILPVVLYYMYRNGELKKIPELLTGILLPLFLIFALFFLFYGNEAGMASIYWSFGVSADYVSQSNAGGVPSYRPDNPVMYVANLVFAISIFTSLLIFAAASYIKDRPVTAYEHYFCIAAAAFASTILIRQYLHYWILALPFIALLCARLFRDNR